MFIVKVIVRVLEIFMSITLGFGFLIFAELVFGLPVLFGLQFIHAKTDIFHIILSMIGGMVILLGIALARKDWAKEDAEDKARKLTPMDNIDSTPHS